MIMLPYIIVGIASAATSALTFFSGFGLGTLLMPIFAIFFPVELAVMATAIVHFSNNIFKISLVGKFAERDLVIRFGLPAIVAALFGAFALGFVSKFGSLFRYNIGPHIAVITPVKFVIGSAMILFAMLELLPSFRDLKFDRKYLPIGGALSGFFGGLSGHQGALRSAFLTKVGASTEGFVGTNAVIGFAVDVVRLSVYAFMLITARTAAKEYSNEWPIIITGIIFAFVGVMMGKRYLHKITMRTVQTLTGILLLGIAIALISGVI